MAKKYTNPSMTLPWYSEVRAYAPLDNRLVVPNEDALTTLSTWKAADNSYYVYTGMTVTTASGDLWTYIGRSDTDANISTDIVLGSKWKKIGGDVSYDSVTGTITINGSDISLKDRVVSSGEIVPVTQTDINEVISIDYYGNTGISIGDYQFFYYGGSYDPNVDPNYYILDSSKSNPSVEDLIQMSNQLPIEGDKYLQLTIADQDNPIFINVKDLVDVYTANNPSGNDVTVTINGSNQISASITAGSITTNKLDSTVQGNLSKASTSIQGVNTGDSSSTYVNNSKMLNVTNGNSDPITVENTTYSGYVLTTTKFVKDYVENNSTLYWEEPDASN